MKLRSYEKSLQEWRESQRFVVPASSFLAKSPMLFSLGAYPIYLSEGKGAWVKDLDGNKYLDFQSSFGPTILGHAYPRVNTAMIEQIRKGTLMSLLQPRQNELAKLLCEIIPCAERVRFFKTGSDATTGAIRIARAFTGRTKVASCHFHGWHDWCYATETTMTRGIPSRAKEEIVSFNYNDLDSLKKIFEENKDQIAAVILEPANLDAPKEGFLEKVKELAKENGAVLIFDEVVTGFRFALGGAQAFFNVTPDLACVAKAIANGAPMAAVVGQKEIMDATADVVTSTTYAEDAIAIAAAIATIKELREKPVIDEIWRLGALFQRGYQRLAEQYGAPTTCVGFPVRLELRFNDQNGHQRLKWKTSFLQESADRGILFGNAIFLNYSHSEAHVRQALKVCEAIFRAWKRNKNVPLALRGEQTQELW